MLINRQFGRDHVLLRRLAIGGQSEVFLALKRGPEDYSRPVVIKALPPKARDDEKYIDLFYREAFIASRFMHPNVINVHDARMIEDEHCMLMDFVSGQTVADIAQRGYQQGTPPTLKQVVQIVADSLAGLNYVHDFRDIDNRRYSVVHRDVSPQNLMVTYQGVTMVFDFGIAKVYGLETEAQPTLGGGKYAYMSPEQLAGDEVDPRSDIFSMGIILYELATGYRLFRRKTPPAVIKAVTKEPIRPPRELKPDIPEALETVIMRALERDPHKRFSSAAEMRDDMLAAVEGMGERGDVRRSLGAYVAALFKEERASIARTLNDAPEIVAESQPMDEGASLGDLAVDPKTPDDSTMELEFDEEAYQRAMEYAASLSGERDAPGARTDTPNPYTPEVSKEIHQQALLLNEEVEKLYRHQKVLYLALAVAAAIAAFLGVLQFVGASPAPAAAEASEVQATEQ
jgi:serine/threonine protein kinase